MLLAGIIAETGDPKIRHRPTRMSRSESQARIAGSPTQTVRRTALLSRIGAYESDPKKVYEAIQGLRRDLVRFGIVQVDETTLDQVYEVRDRYHEHLELTKRDHGLEWAMLQGLRRINNCQPSSTPKPMSYTLSIPSFAHVKVPAKGCSAQNHFVPAILRVQEDVR
jgi:hypothetical protein